MTQHGLIRNWDYTPSATPLSFDREVRAILLHGLQRAPASAVLKPVTPHPRWTLYFVFTPDGQLTTAHRFTLAKLKTLDRRLLVVCAAPAVGDVPAELHETADALYWKALPGYDFSAYALGLHAIARRSSGADVFVMNDSVYGPFDDIAGILAAPRWDLTGFTASSERQNHIQSYAFHLRNVTRARMRDLRSVFYRHLSLSDVNAVIRLQEVRFASVAARTMTVGSLWFDSTGANPSLDTPIELLDDGFLFVKRSLEGKYAHQINPDELQERLAAFGHPRIPEKQP